jgi:hypothetical protein
VLRRCRGAPSLPPRPLPAGIVLIQVDADARATVTAGPSVPVLSGSDHTTTVHVVVDSDADTTLTVDGDPVTVHSGQIERLLVTTGPALPETRAERLADLVTVLDKARTFYRTALDRAPR